ncbi:gustatory receptor 23a-like [Anastrepha obliqua]|uniref:gustatory receptor 23a-like n=1 Tax=Anastrepha obliqua TaxID=95512 RepID=UPI00240A156C|nr:gustatory receptor 23a-like [Anastrepha obliqua]
MQRLEWLIKSVLRTLCCLTTLLPIPHLPLLSTFLRLAMLAWLTANFYVVFSFFFEDVIFNLADILGLIHFHLDLFIYVVAIVESMVKKRSFGELTTLRCQLHELGANHLSKAEVAAYPVRSMILVFSVPLFCELVRLWVMFTTYRTPVSYYSVLLELGTQTRFLQIINTIMTLNQEAQNVTKLLEKLVAQNKHKSRYGSDIWMPYTPREYEQLNLLRLLYGRLYKAYGCADDCFAWCILLFIMEKFFFLVCNLYWCAQMFFEEPTIFKIFYNLSSTLKAGFQIVVLCAIGSEVENYSRYIGCLISRLPKPLGNKPYNDLVTNFSIQTLHQQFSIKAKHFCVLNRTLLGSMISAIITYSVILIQFLLGEK